MNANKENKAAKRITVTSNCGAFYLAFPIDFVAVAIDGRRSFQGASNREFIAL